MKKRLTIVMAVVCCLALMVGTMAFFTDRYDTSANATAGNINLQFTDQSLAAEGLTWAVNDQGTPETADDVLEQIAGGTQARDNVWTDGKMLVNDGVLNPGDTIDLDYKVANAGSKSIDVKQQIVLTSNVALTDDAEEYKIIVGGQSITPAKSADDMTLTYELAEIVLSGSVEEDGTSTEQAYEISMAFDRLAKNKFMGSTVTVDLDIQAKQHRNTASTDWVDWATYTASVEQIA